jgi:AcrR family transcriptional regulator
MGLICEGALPWGQSDEEHAGMNEKVEMLMERLDVTRKGAERIANIVDAGVEILRTEGFTALTKRRIAKRLGISDGNVSYYFPTRESLWKGVIEYELKTYYDSQYRNFATSSENPVARFEEVVRLWFREYEDRNLRIFFAQLLAYAEVSTFVAEQRNEIYQSFFDETVSCVRGLKPGLSDKEIETRSALIMAMLEGSHAVTAFKPGLLSSGAGFQEKLIAEAHTIAMRDSTPG